MTALVVQDFLGGDLILGEVHVDGIKVGNHYWNRVARRPGGAVSSMSCCANAS